MQTPPFISDIKSGIINLFEENQWTSFAPIENEINLFLQQSEEKLKKWHFLYREGLLSLDEIEWLVISQRESITLQVLKNAGINQIKINTLQNSILKIILKSIIIRI